MFLELADTPYAKLANHPNNHPIEEPVEKASEDGEVNPSASLNEWLVFPSSQDLEVQSCISCFYMISFCAAQVKLLCLNDLFSVIFQPTHCIAAL
jgi:hypothetical protein